MKVRCAAVGSVEKAMPLADLPRKKPSLDSLLSKAMAFTRNPSGEPKALQVYEQILRLYPDEPLALNNAAWFLLTTEDEKLRDPRRALPIARKAAERSEEEDGNILDTLAKALHDTGDLAAAARYAKMAAELAPETEEIVGRAKEYAAEAAKAKGE